MLRLAVLSPGQIEESREGARERENRTGKERDASRWVISGLIPESFSIATNASPWLASRKHSTR